MTQEKKPEEQAAGEAQAKSETVVLDEAVLEQLLVGCIWDVLRRMHRVANKAITPDQATEEDDAIARHLARTLMGENPGFTSALPLVGPALVEDLRRLPDYGEDKLPEEIDAANPRAVMVYVCRTFLHGIYDMVRTLTKDDEMTPEKLSETVTATAAFWTLRLTGRRAEKLN